MSPMPPWMFNLEGTLLGFLGPHPDQPKSIVLEVEQEQMAIKLPKALRANLRQQLQLGDRVRCIGRSHIDFDSGVIKLDAYQLFTLPDPGRIAEPLASPASLPSIPLGLTPSPPSAPRTAPKRARILVCQKSGCQKRGGRQMIARLKQVLQERQLQNQVEIQSIGCQKRCSKAPNLTIMPGKHRYDSLKLENLPVLIEEHFGSANLPLSP
ncbi:MAG: (2Fe-2S) ferredoxin domain-containing protein [Almyronema sp.]